MNRRPLSRTTRALAVLGAAALTLGLAACGGDDAAETTATDTTASASADATDSDAADQATEDAADDEAAAPAEGAVEAEDGSFSVVLPEGFTAQTPEAGQAEMEPGTAMLLQASKPMPEAEDTMSQASTLLGSMQPEKSLDALVEEMRTSLQESMQTEVEGAETTVSDPQKVDVDGEEGQIVRTTIRFADEASGISLNQSLDTMMVNRGGSTYTIMIFGPIDESGANPLEEMAGTWRWN